MRAATSSFTTGRDGAEVTRDETPVRKIWPWITWTYEPVEAYAYALIRFSTGMILMTHGAARLVRSDNAFGFNAWLASLPPTGVGAFEFFGGLALAFGLLTRPVSLLFGLLWLLFTLGHQPSGRPGNWLMLGAIDHYPAMLMLLCVAFLFRGGGFYSLDRRIGKEF